MAFILTRIEVGDYEAWKPLFDQDRPGARRTALGHRLFRNTENPNEVFIEVEFDSADEARAARERLLASGVLDRFLDKTGPSVVEQAERSMSENSPTPAICLVVDHPGETADQFETVLAHLGRTGPVPPLGASLLVSGPTETGWRSVSVWDSHASIARFFGERLVPAYREAGLAPEHARQSTFDVHTILVTPTTA